MKILICNYTCLGSSVGKMVKFHQGLHRREEFVNQGVPVIRDSKGEQNSLNSSWKDHKVVVFLKGFEGSQESVNRGLHPSHGLVQSWDQSPQTSPFKVQRGLRLGLISTTSFTNQQHSYVFRVREYKFHQHRETEVSSSDLKIVGKVLWPQGERLTWLPQCLWQRCARLPNSGRPLLWAITKTLLTLGSEGSCPDKLESGP